MEKTILSHLVHTDEYARRVLPFLKREYFTEESDAIVYDLITDYVREYNTLPPKEALYIELENKAVHEDAFNGAQAVISQLETHSEDVKWLLDKTEKFCQDKAIYNAIKKAIKLIDDKGATSRGILPKLLEEAISVSFDTNIGHDYTEDSAARYEIYHKKHDRIGFDLKYLNAITGDGWLRKTLNVFMGPPGTGKTLVMCHQAAHNLMSNKNVLYITLEMAEERIAQRIDANLMGVTMNELMQLTKLEYTKKMERVKETTKGRLIVKEFPPTSAGAAHFRHLLHELKLKKKFVPDIIYIDYLNLCISSRLKITAQVNSYTLVKSIAEELRGLAVEFNLPIVSATQANRDAINSSDVGMENTSESMGLPATVDMLIALISTEELQDLNQMMFKQLKNRYGDLSINRRFIVGVDRAKMRLYDVEDSAQEDLLDGPVMDNTDVMRDEDSTKKIGKTKFKGFK